ncbi:putative galactarate dehydratase (L-threo-forming) [Emticicia aquatilis]|uniref:Galactarate dehydratase n=1 Tax=Emticicia aquatilis TaxID=1537369 RepID=A0A916Z122_9BACT|nr:galactarate dehydratase [Emticicia aquatilis]GGD69345.1 putative galactarate dehydratase (L-threo-forming) [Emticicia aquatilis]
MQNIVIKTNPIDNVAIVANPTGLKRGAIVLDGVVFEEDIPMGHKVALKSLNEGDEVIRYGQIIGYANRLIEKGSWVNESNISMPQPPNLENISYVQPTVPQVEPLKNFTFQGFKNADGSVGTKNVLGITTSVQCVAGITNFIENKIRKELLPLYPNVDDVVAFNHSYGCGIAIDAPAAIIPIRTIKHIAKNPNFGGEIMIIGLGCEKLRPERLLPDDDGLRLRSASDTATERSRSILYLQDEQFEGFYEMVDGIMEMAEKHLQKLNQRKRETCSVVDLVVGMQCGGSDAFSGLTGNPVAGFAADLIVKGGGTVFFSEVTEVRDAIHLLVPRCESAEVAQKLKDEMAWYDNYLNQGQADRSANTTPGNKGGGLSNIVEKALGSVVKSGTSPIVDVVSPGEKVRKKGLNFVATPASDFACGTLQLAAGMNMHVFITGRGTPYGLNMVPVIKVSSNSKLANRWHDLIDFDAGPVAFGQKTIEEMGWELFRLILEIASGNKKVATDKLGLYNDLVLFNPGPLT